MNTDCDGDTLQAPLAYSIIEFGRLLLARGGAAEANCKHDELCAVKKRERLIRFLSARAVSHEERLAEMRAQAEALRQRPDVVWLLLLQSAATMGNSRGWNGLFGDSMLPTLIGFNAVGAIRPDLRASYMAPILQTASVRMPRQKAEALARNHAIISDLGGEAAARATAFAQPTRDSKIAFMKRFHGIGDKYARNVWMDLYDPHFHDAIAYDERLKKIAAAMGHDSRVTWRPSSTSLS